MLVYICSVPQKQQCQLHMGVESLRMRDPEHSVCVYDNWMSSVEQSLCNYCLVATMTNIGHAAYLQKYVDGNHSDNRNAGCQWRSVLKRFTYCCSWELYTYQGIAFLGHCRAPGLNSLRQVVQLMQSLISN